MEEREIIVEDIMAPVEEEDVMNDKGFAFMYKENTSFMLFLSRILKNKKRCNIYEENYKKQY